MADRSQTRRRGYRRNYQACEACKKQKGRCDLGSPDNPQPPCTRCRRAMQECVFGPTRFTSRRGNGSISPVQQAASNDHSNTASPNVSSASNAGPAETGPWLSAEVAPGGGAPTSTATGQATQSFARVRQESVAPQGARRDGAHLRDHLMNAQVKNPMDAMRILSHTVRYGNSDGDSHTYAPTSTEAWNVGTRPDHHLIHSETLTPNHRGSDDTFSTWMHFRLCKDKLLSPVEAVHLLNYFFVQMNATNPIISDKYHDPANHKMLLQEEPTLACTILAVASRYEKLPGDAAISRGMIVHNSLFRHIQTSIQRVTWGFGHEGSGIGTNLGLIESLLIFTSWNPRALYLLSDISELAPPVDFETEEHAENFFESTLRGIHAHVLTKLTRQANKMSWMLMGIASTLAHEIGLFDEAVDNTNISSQPLFSDLERRLRVKKLVVLHTVEVYFRMGKAATLHQPFSVPLGSPSASPTWLDDSSRGLHHALDCSIELAQLANFATNSLYQSPSQTRSIILSKRYFDLVAHFDRSFTNWFAKFQSIPAPRLFSFQCEIVYHNARSYIHLIGVQAILERSLSVSGSGTRSDPRRTFLASNTTARVNLPETSRDLELIKVIATGCRRTMDLALELHRMGAFRNCTDSLLQNLITTIIFSLKVAGLNIAPRVDMIHMIRETVNIIETSAVDDVHLGPIYADSLRTLIGKVESQPSVRIPFDHASDSTDNNMTTATEAQNENNAGFSPGPREITTPIGGEQTFVSEGFVDGIDSDGLTDWNQWLAFQLDPIFSAFETGFLLDPAYNFQG